MTFAEDYQVGEVFDLGTHVVTANEIVEFATRYDPQPYHLSAAAGKDSFFGGLVASGWHTASLWMGLYVRHILLNAGVQGSPGVDELRWFSPVRPGDRLRGSVEIVDAVPNVFKREIVTLKKRGLLQRDGETSPVMTLILHSRFLRRPTSVDALAPNQKGGCACNQSH